MTDRFRLLQAATALLYLGPLLAGLSGQGWDMVPLFTAIFVLWSMVMRPHLWPSHPGDIARPEAVVALMALIATQILLVCASFGIGRGIGRLLDLQGLVPLYLPAALSFLSIPLSRMVWNPDQTETVTGRDPLHPSPPQAAPPPAEDLAQSLLAQILALPDDVGEADLQARLSAIGLDALALRRTLQETARHPRFTRAGLKALVVHATDPSVAELLSGSAYPAEVFALLGQDAGLLSLFATRSTRLIQATPQLAPDFPDPTALTAPTLPAEARAALAHLADLLVQSTPLPPA